MDKKKKRSNTDYNLFELITCILLLYDVKCYNDLILIIHNLDKSIIIFNNDNDFNKYILNIDKNIKNIDQFINNFHNSDLPDNLKKDNIVRIYVSGKNNKHDIIKKLNDKLDKKETKSDMYIFCRNEEIIGMSVKQNNKSTKSNYSVQKFFDKQKDKELTKLKKKYLNDNGFYDDNKDNREQINKLFYQDNKENPYWLRLKEEIENNKQNILNKIIDLLYCINVPYDVYEFNGINLILLRCNKEELNATLIEYLPYYYRKDGNIRNTAKLFYRLTIYPTKVITFVNYYRVDIRWKGSVYKASPQFQIHNE